MKKAKEPLVITPDLASAGAPPRQPALKTKETRSKGATAVIEQLDKHHRENVTNHKALLSKLEETMSSTKETKNELREVTKQLYGYSEGYNEGYSQGFNAGIKYLVTATEEEMVREMKLASREELVEGKLPAFWIICLVKNLKHLISVPLPSHLKSTPAPRKRRLEETNEQEPKATELGEEEV